MEVWVPPGGSPDGVAPSPVNSPPSAPILGHAPYTTEEFDDLLGTVWGDLEADPHRFDDLLADTLGFIGGLALNPHLGSVTVRATEHLRAAEQRALWGPNHEQEDHR